MMIRRNEESWKRQQKCCLDSEAAVPQSNWADEQLLMN